MKNLNKDIKILIAINIFLILATLFINGETALIIILTIFIINLIASIYGFATKNKKFGIAALILTFIGPIIGFSICLSIN